MLPSGLTRIPTKGNGSREVCWIRVTSKHERLRINEDLFLRGVEGLLMKCVSR